MNILNTTRINFELENLINEAEDYLIFLSPYLKIGEKLKNIIISKTSTIKHIIFLCRKNEISRTELKFLESHKTIELIDIPRLHAKCYINENRVILTSMNLYDYSQINNFELGVMFTKKKESVKYRTLLQEIHLMLNVNDLESKLVKEILDKVIDFGFSELTAKILKNYSIGRSKNNGLDGDYKFLSQEAIKVYNFKKSELYQDNSAVLRSTRLNQKDFNYLYENIAIKLNKKR